MGRSLFRDVLIDKRGNALSGITVDVFNTGTTTPVAGPIYSGATGVATLTNPFTVTSTNRGEVIFYLDVQPGERVDVRYSGTNVVTETVTLDGVSPDDLGAGGGVTDHGALTGLADDDHSQYETSAEAQAKVDAHTTDAVDAHDASAISFVPAGTIAATDVQAAIEEVASEAGGGSADNGLKSVQVFGTAGSFTYTLPAGITAILVECIGAGGGAAGVATAAGTANVVPGGGGGGYAEKFIANPDASYAYSVGAGGAGGAAGDNPGSTGGNTTFGSPSVCTATGGTGGTTGGTGTASNIAGGPGNGGAGTVGDILLTGSDGGNGIRLSGTIGASGTGGAAARGGGTVRAKSAAGAGANGFAPGGGAQGALVLNGSAAVAGGSGADGRIVVWEFGPA